MRQLGRPALFGIVLALVLLPILVLRGASLAQDAYVFVSPQVMVGGPIFHSLTLLNANNENTALFHSDIASPADLQSFRGLPADFTLMNAYELAGGSAFTIALNGASPDAVVVYKISADGTLAQFFDVSFEAGALHISTAGEAAPATYVVGTQSQFAAPLL